MNNHSWAKLDDYTQHLSEMVLAHVTGTLNSKFKRALKAIDQKQTGMTPKDVEELKLFISVNVYQTCLIASVAAIRELNGINTTNTDIVRFSDSILFSVNEQLKFLDDLMTVPSRSQRETESN